MYNIYIIFDDETRGPDCSCRRGVSKCFCVGMIALRNDEAVALFWCMAAQRRNLAWMAKIETYSMLSVRYGMTLLSMIWILLPDDLRNLLVNALSR